METRPSDRNSPLSRPSHGISTQQSVKPSIALDSDPKLCSNFTISSQQSPPDRFTRPFASNGLVSNVGDHTSNARFLSFLTKEKCPSTNHGRDVYSNNPSKSSSQDHSTNPDVDLSESGGRRRRRDGRGRRNRTSKAHSPERASSSSPSRENRTVMPNNRIIASDTSSSGNISTTTHTRQRGAAKGPFVSQTVNAGHNTPVTSSVSRSGHGTDAVRAKHYPAATPANGGATSRGPPSSSRLQAPNLVLPVSTNPTGAEVGRSHRTRESINTASTSATLASTISGIAAGAICDGAPADVGPVASSTRNRRNRVNTAAADVSADSRDTPVTTASTTTSTSQQRQRQQQQHHHQQQRHQKQPARAFPSPPPSDPPSSSASPYFSAHTTPSSLPSPLLTSLPTLPSLASVDASTPWLVPREHDSPHITHLRNHFYIYCYRTDYCRLFQEYKCPFSKPFRCFFAHYDNHIRRAPRLLHAHTVARMIAHAYSVLAARVCDSTAVGSVFTANTGTIAKSVGNFAATTAPDTLVNAVASAVIDISEGNCAAVMDTGAHVVDALAQRNAAASGAAETASARQSGASWERRNQDERGNENDSEADGRNKSGDVCDDVVDGDDDQVQHQTCDSASSLMSADVDGTSMSAVVDPHAVLQRILATYDIPIDAPETTAGGHAADASAKDVKDVTESSALIIHTISPVSTAQGKRDGLEQSTLQRGVCAARQDTGVSLSDGLGASPLLSASISPSTLMSTTVSAPCGRSVVRVAWRYSSIPCLYASVLQCPLRQRCPFAHTVQKENILHPCKYKTRLCEHSRGSICHSLCRDTVDMKKLEVKLLRRLPLLPMARRREHDFVRMRGIMRAYMLRKYKHLCGHGVLEDVAPLDKYAWATANGCERVKMGTRDGGEDDQGGESGVHDETTAFSSVSTVPSTATPTPACASTSTSAAASASARKSGRQRKGKGKGNDKAGDTEDVKELNRCCALASIDEHQKQHHHCHTHNKHTSPQQMSAAEQDRWLNIDMDTLPECAFASCLVYGAHCSKAHSAQELRLMDYSGGDFPDMMMCPGIGGTTPGSLNGDVFASASASLSPSSSAATSTSMSMFGPAADDLSGKKPPGEFPDGVVTEMTPDGPVLDREVLAEYELSLPCCADDVHHPSPLLMSPDRPLYVYVDMRGELLQLREYMYKFFLTPAERAEVDKRGSIGETVDHSKTSRPNIYAHLDEEREKPKGGKKDKDKQTEEASPMSCPNTSPVPYSTPSMSPVWLHAGSGDDVVFTQYLDDPCGYLSSGNPHDGVSVQASPVMTHLLSHPASPSLAASTPASISHALAHTPAHQAYTTTASGTLLAAERVVAAHSDVSVHDVAAGNGRMNVHMSSAPRLEGELAAHDGLHISTADCSAPSLGVTTAIHLHINTTAPTVSVSCDTSPAIVATHTDAIPDDNADTSSARSAGDADTQLLQGGDVHLAQSSIGVGAVLTTYHTAAPGSVAGAIHATASSHLASAAFGSTSTSTSVSAPIASPTVHTSTCATTTSALTTPAPSPTSSLTTASPASALTAPPLATLTRSKRDLSSVSITEHQYIRAEPRAGRVVFDRELRGTSPLEILDKLGRGAEMNACAMVVDVEAAAKAVAEARAQFVKEQREGTGMSMNAGGVSVDRDSMGGEQANMKVEGNPAASTNADGLSHSTTSTSTSTSVVSPIPPRIPVSQLPYAQYTLRPAQALKAIRRRWKGYSAREQEFYRFACPPEERDAEHFYFMFHYKTRMCEAVLRARTGIDTKCVCNGLDAHREEELRPVDHTIYQAIACPKVKPYLLAKWGEPKLDCKQTFSRLYRDAHAEIPLGKSASTTTSSTKHAQLQAQRVSVDVVLSVDAQQPNTNDGGCGGITSDAGDGDDDVDVAMGAAKAIDGDANSASFATSTSTSASTSRATDAFDLASLDAELGDVTRTKPLPEILPMAPEFQPLIDIPNSIPAPTSSLTYDCSYSHTLMSLMYHVDTYKTRLCANFDENDRAGYKCVWRRRCAHAHGTADLRTPADVARIKCWLVTVTARYLWAGDDRACPALAQLSQLPVKVFGYVEGSATPLLNMAEETVKRGETTQMQGIAASTVPGKQQQQRRKPGQKVWTTVATITGQGQTPYVDGPALRSVPYSSGGVTHYAYYASPPTTGQYGGMAGSQVQQSVYHHMHQPAYPHQQQHHQQPHQHAHMHGYQQHPHSQMPMPGYAQNPSQASVSSTPHISSSLPSGLSVGDTVSPMLPHVTSHTAQHVQPPHHYQQQQQYHQHQPQQRHLQAQHLPTHHSFSTLSSHSPYDTAHTALHTYSAHAAHHTHTTYTESSLPSSSCSSPSSTLSHTPYASPTLHNSSSTTSAYSQSHPASTSSFPTSSHSLVSANSAHVHAQFPSSFGLHDHHDVHTTANASAQTNAHAGAYAGSQGAQSQHTHAHQHLHLQKNPHHQQSLQHGPLHNQQMGQQGYPHNTTNTNASVGAAMGTRVGAGTGIDKGLSTGMGLSVGVNVSLPSPYSTARSAHHARTLPLSPSSLSAILCPTSPTHSSHSSLISFSSAISPTSHAAASVNMGGKQTGSTRRQMQNSSLSAEYISAREQDDSQAQDQDGTDCAEQNTTQTQQLAGKTVGLETLEEIDNIHSRRDGALTRTTTVHMQGVTAYDVGDSTAAVHDSTDNVAVDHESLSAGAGAGMGMGVPKSVGSPSWEHYSYPNAPLRTQLPSSSLYSQPLPHHATYTHTTPTTTTTTAVTAASAASANAAAVDSAVDLATPSLPTFSTHSSSPSASSLPTFSPHLTHLSAPMYSPRTSHDLYTPATLNANSNAAHPPTSINTRVTANTDTAAAGAAAPCGASVTAATGGDANAPSDSVTSSNVCDASGRDVKHTTHPSLPSAFSSFFPSSLPASTSATSASTVAASTSASVPGAPSDATIASFPPYLSYLLSQPSQHTQTHSNVPNNTHTTHNHTNSRLPTPHPSHLASFHQHHHANPPTESSHVASGAADHAQLRRQETSTISTPAPRYGALRRPQDADNSTHRHTNNVAQHTYMHTHDTPHTIHGVFRVDNDAMYPHHSHTHTPTHARMPTQSHAHTHAHGPGHEHARPASEQLRPGYISGRPPLPTAAGYDRVSGHSSVGGTYDEHANKSDAYRQAEDTRSYSYNDQGQGRYHNQGHIQSHVQGHGQSQGPARGPGSRGYEKHTFESHGYPSRGGESRGCDSVSHTGHVYEGYMLGNHTPASSVCSISDSYAASVSTSATRNTFLGVSGSGNSTGVGAANINTDVNAGNPNITSALHMRACSPSSSGSVSKEVFPSGLFVSTPITATASTNTTTPLAVATITVASTIPGTTTAAATPVESHTNTPALSSTDVRSRASTMSLPETRGHAYGHTYSFEFSEDSVHGFNGHGGSQHGAHPYRTRTNIIDTANALHTQQTQPNTSYRGTGNADMKTHAGADLGMGAGTGEWYAQNQWRW